MLARLRHHIFYSLDALNQQLRFLTKELNARPMKSYNGLSRNDLFQQIDLPALKARAHPYEYTEHKIVKVAPDYHVQYDKHLYSVPHSLCGERQKSRPLPALSAFIIKANVWRSMCEAARYLARQVSWRISHQRMRRSRNGTARDYNNGQATLDPTPWVWCWRWSGEKPIRCRRNGLAWSA